MRQESPPALRAVVADFVDASAALPVWVESAGAERAGRGHYEWGNWSDLLRGRRMWLLGGPWRTLVAELRLAALLTTAAELHRLKDQTVWELVEQTYLRAEADRASAADPDTVKTRIRSVFSWQRRHDVKKHSLVWFLDFAFALAAYEEFQATQLFRVQALDDPASRVEELAPRDFGVEAERMERTMLAARFLPFYARVAGLANALVIEARAQCAAFARHIAPPDVQMNMDVRETRGMPREEKAVDFMTPWLARLSHEEHNARWDALLRWLCAYKTQLADAAEWGRLVTEVCRAVVAHVLLQVCMANGTDSGYVADVAASTAVEQSDPDLLVPIRTAGQKRKRLVSRHSLRRVLDSRVAQWEDMHAPSQPWEARGRMYRDGASAVAGPPDVDEYQRAAAVAGGAHLDDEREPGSLDHAQGSSTQGQDSLAPLQPPSSSSGSHRGGGSNIQQVLVMSSLCAHNYKDLNAW